VTAVVGKGDPDTTPLSIIDVSAATGARLGVDLLPVWQHRFALRLSAELLVTFRDVTIHLADASPMSASNAPAAWTTPRLTVAFGAGIVTDLRLK
jgi:hypothetical protein